MTTPAGAAAVTPGTVYLAGAGPGSLDLLTMRAHAVLSSASCLLHDDLVSAEVLSLALPHALVRNVGKRCGKKTITQEEINRWMIQYAKDGHSVVRLKSGDPLLFGRAAEEIAALTDAAVPFEVIPGISAGFAAAALACLPLTGRISNSRVLFATRHLSAGSTNGLAGITPEATLVLYMPGRDYAAIAAELGANGWSTETTCLVASALGTESQRLEFCTLRDFRAMTPLPAPVVMMFYAVEKPGGPAGTDSEHLRGMF
jgi:uroporphyrin-III C-methyltransferase